jgi:hypothetical protein
LRGRGRGSGSGPGREARGPRPASRDAPPSSVSFRALWTSRSRGPPRRPSVRPSPRSPLSSSTSFPSVFYPRNALRDFLRISFPRGEREGRLSLWPLSRRPWSARRPPRRPLRGPLRRRSVLRRTSLASSFAVASSPFRWCFVSLGDLIYAGAATSRLKPDPVGLTRPTSVPFPRDRYSNIIDPDEPPALPSLPSGREGRMPGITLRAPPQGRDAPASAGTTARTSPFIVKRLQRLEEGSSDPSTP